MSVATKDVFAALHAPPLGQHKSSAVADAEWAGGGRQELIEFVARHGNDLEPPAISLHPAIAQALAALRALTGCRLARMSGSGASCFGLFDSDRAAAAAARALRVGASAMVDQADGAGGIGTAPDGRRVWSESR